LALESPSHIWSTAELAEHDSINNGMAATISRTNRLCIKYLSSLQFSSTGKPLDEAGLNKRPGNCCFNKPGLNLTKF
jgi:hypothetical protein